MDPARSLEAFAECVAADAALREQLAREPDHARFAACCETEGTRRGFVFTAADVRQALQRTNLAWLQRNLW